MALRTQTKLYSRYLHDGRLGVVFGLSLAFCTQGCGFDPSPSRWIFSGMSYDYTACKRSLEYLFGLEALGKIKSWYKFASLELRCLPLGRKLGVKITCGNWYPPIEHRTKN
ncbi:hypothetical protein TNCV_2264671 [Trichonephila clavipes]|nr:hypothetical protein TNCV_2264671 [Trichonephila clavipes]